MLLANNMLTVSHVQKIITYKIFYTASERDSSGSPMSKKLISLKNNNLRCFAFENWKLAKSDTNNEKKLKKSIPPHTHTLPPPPPPSPPPQSKHIKNKNY